MFHAFGSDYFVWMDVGYGKSSQIVRKFINTTWPDSETMRVMDGNRIHVLQVYPVSDSKDMRQFELKRHLNHEVHHAGGIFGGSRSAINWYSKKYDKILEDRLVQGIVGDDQAVVTSVYTDDHSVRVNFLGRLKYWVKAKFLSFEPLGKGKLGAVS